MFASRGRFALPWRRRARRGDEGSMPLAVLVTLVGVTLSAGVSGLVISQIKESKLASDRVAAVAAAQAGLDASLARVRASVTSLVGDLAKLPCGVLTPPPGSDQPAYRASIGYFLTDPSDKAGALAPLGDLTNISPLLTGTPVSALLTSIGNTVTSVTQQDAVTTALRDAVGCVGGLVQQVPRYGLFRSTSTVGGITRTLYATYTFKTSEELIPGGHIPVAVATGAQALCIGAAGAGATVAVGAAAIAVPCDSADDFHALLIYPRNLSISLVKSRETATAGVPYGLCLTAALQAVNQPLTFTPCAATKIPSQQWEYEVNKQTYWGTSNGTTRSGFCINVATPIAAGQPIILKNGNGNCGTSGAVGKAFTPEPKVGSGAASITTGQLVNFGEVGRCLDVTNQNVLTGGSYFTSRSESPALIAYPCKQDFTGNVFWNHRWYPPTIPADDWKATGQVKVIPGTGDPEAGIPYCLKSPGAGGGRVWVDKCSVGGINQQWTISSLAPLDKDSYQLVDSSGNCLTAGYTFGTQYRYDGKWSMIITAACSNSPIQKWNKPRSSELGPLSSIKER